MRQLPISISFVLIIVFALAVRAEPRLFDALGSEMFAVSLKLSKGQKREEILRSLQAAIEKNPGSGRAAAAKELARDLADSIEADSKRAKAGHKLEETPEEFLDESTLPLYLPAYSQNKQSLTAFAEKHPQDPAILMIKQGRGAIERLIPALQNRAPLAGEEFQFRDEPRVDRVCDLALRVIEHLSLCKFHFNASTGTAFHELQPDVRQQHIARIERWWKENKNRTLIEGIRSQLPHAEFYEKVDMVKALIRQAEQEKSKSDKEFGLQTLRDMLRGDIGHTAAHTAYALAEFGDFSAIDQFYKDLTGSLDVPGRYWGRETEVVFYLTKYGKRREWELLVKIAQKEIDQGKEAGEAGVWPALVNCHDATKTPYMIPGLGLALSQTKQSGSRFINEKIGSQNFSNADKAAQYLQELTKADFGYQTEGTEAERMAAIKLAQKWWAEEGKAKYTFDYIESELVKGTK